jgi:hypothetical protein
MTAPLACLLALGACGNVAPGGTSGGKGVGSSSNGSNSSSASGASGGSASGCPGATIDAGTCSAYGACVTASVTGACKPSYDACYGAGGPCAAYLTCTAPCECSNSACVSACASSMTSSCTNCLQAGTTCSEDACSTQFAQCLVGVPDAGIHTCADLARCCASLPAADQSTCLQVVSVGNGTVCSTFFAAVACP